MSWGLLFWSAVVAALTAHMAYVHVKDWRKAGSCSACKAASLLPLALFVIVGPGYAVVASLGVPWWVRVAVFFLVLFPLFAYQSRLRRWLHRTDTRPEHLTRIGGTAHTSRTSP